MCLVVVSWQQHPAYSLIVAGNRDEFHARPTQDAHWWSDHPDIVAGRDRQAGGTWFGVHRNGRFATVTNFRDAEPTSPRYRSRGHLVTEFLASNVSPADYLASIDGAKFAGFNLLVSDNDTLAYLSNRGEGVQVLQPGTYALSNALLDTPWHKVVRSKRVLSQLIANDDINETTLLRLLNDRKKAPAADIESTRLPFEAAHAISAPFIVLPDYGTRSSSIALRESQGSWRVYERRFDSTGTPTGDSSFSVKTPHQP